MTGQETTAEATFKEMEQAGWEVMAPDYDALAGQITMQAMDALLDAAKASKGTRLRVERAEMYKAGSTYDIAWPAVIASGSKP